MSNLQNFLFINIIIKMYITKKKNYFKYEKVTVRLKLLYLKSRSFIPFPFSGKKKH